MRQGLVFGLFGAFLLIVAGLTGAWFIGAEMVRHNVMRLAEDAAADGRVLAVARVDVEGFPFSYQVTLNDMVMSGDSRDGPWEWRAERIVADMLPWRPGEARFDLAGTHRLRLNRGRVPVNLDIAAQSAPGLWIRSTGETPQRFRLQPAQVTLRETLSEKTLTIDRATLQWEQRADGLVLPTVAAAGFLVDLHGLGLPAGRWHGLGDRIENVGIEGQFLGGVPLPAEKSVLTRWRANGGSLDIQSIVIDWGPGRLDASGTAALDTDLQPEAALTLDLTGHEQTIRALVEAGVIDQKVGNAISLVMGILAGRPAPGERPRLSVPVTVQDRTVFVGPIRVARLPPVTW